MKNVEPTLAMQEDHLAAANRALALLRSASPKLKSVTVNDAISAFSDIADLPPTTESMFRDCVQVVLDASSSEHSGYTFMSSGTMGDAKFGVYPRDLLVPEISRAWDLDFQPGRRFVDLSGGGSGWSLGHFFRELALHNGQNYFHLGSTAVSDDFNVLWAPFLEKMRPSTLSGNATVLGGLAERLLQRGTRLHFVKAVFWSAEPIRKHQHRVIAEAFPEAGIWSCYGSTETWVIGVRRSNMPLTHYRILPYQYLEPQSDGTWVTSLHPNAFVPLLRYEMADRVKVLETRPDGFPSLIEILGRSDKQIFFSGKNISPMCILSAVKSLPAIEDAQLVVKRDQDVILEMELRYFSRATDSAITKDELESAIISADSQTTVLREIMKYNVTRDFKINPRTGKCPDIFYH